MRELSEVEQAWGKFHAMVERYDPSELGRLFGHEVTGKQADDLYDALFKAPISSWMTFHAGWLAAKRSIELSSEPPKER